MSKLHSRAALVRSIDAKLSKLAQGFAELKREPFLQTAQLERRCRKLSADAYNLATKAATLLALDKELGDA